MIQYLFYIDETGDFKDDELPAYRNPSAVGGLLCRVPELTEQKVCGILKAEHIHGCEQYNADEYLGYLQELKAHGGKFVMFRN